MKYTKSNVIMQDIMNMLYSNCIDKYSLPNYYVTKINITENNENNISLVFSMRPFGDDTYIEMMQNVIKDIKFHLMDYDLRNINFLFSDNDYSIHVDILKKDNADKSQESQETA